MALEIEAKLRVESHEPIRTRLQSLGADLIGRVVETNDIFDRRDGSLRSRGCGLRVRAVRDDAGQPRGATITWKGPVLRGALKSRWEIESEVGSAEACSELLHELGFTRILRYEKRRESWRLDDCRVELDEPPEIGLFVEIEGPTEAAVVAVQERLGLANQEHVRPSYVHMLCEYCDEHGLTTRELPLR